MGRCNDVQPARGQEIVCVGSGPPERFGCFLSGACVVHSQTTIKIPVARKQAIADVARSLNLMIIDDDCHATVKSHVPSYRAILPKQTYYVRPLRNRLAVRCGSVLRWRPLDKGRSCAKSPKVRTTGCPNRLRTCVQG